MELIASILVAVIVVELYVWLPKISEWLLEFAVRQLRAEDQERCLEEWKAQLDDLPNTIVRLVHALSFTAAARQINADFCEDKLDEFNQRLNNLLEIHRHNRENIETIERMHKNSREHRDFLLIHEEKTWCELYIELNLKSIGLMQESLDGFHKSMTEFLATLHTSLKKADSLMEAMIVRHTTKIVQADMVLQELSNSYNYTNRLFRRPLKLSKSLMSSIDELEKKLEQIETDIKQENECPENDEPRAEYKRITSAIASVVGGGLKLKP
jgi:hypothetical protein